MRSRRIPQTDSIEELSRFWDTHDLTDLEDQLEDVRTPVFARRKASGMNSSGIEIRPAQAQKVRVTTEELVIDLIDGRTVTVPLGWYPRLAHGTAAQRRRWRLIGRGEGIHWPDLDEDIAVEDLLAGRPSGESRTSFHRWLKERGLLGNRRTQPPSRTRRRVTKARSHAARG